MGKIMAGEMISSYVSNSKNKKNSLNNIFNQKLYVHIISFVEES